MSSRKYENLHFDWLLLFKAYKVLDEKVQKSYVSWHWRVVQSLKKNWLLVTKITWEIWWILMRALANLKFCTLMYYLSRSCIIFDPKKVHRSSVITLKNDAKFEQELTCALKHDVRNLANFDTTRKICTLMGFFWPKYIMFDLKKYRGVMRHYTKDWYKLCRKNDMWFHKWHEKFGEFLRSTQKT